MCLSPDRNDADVVIEYLSFDFVTPAGSAGRVGRAKTFAGVEGRTKAQADSEGDEFVHASALALPGMSTSV